MSRVADRHGVLLDGDDAAGGPDGLGKQAGEQPGAAVEIQRRLAGFRFECGQHRIGQHIRGARMHLPEPAEADAPVPAGRALGQVAAAENRGACTVATGDLDGVGGHLGQVTGPQPVLTGNKHAKLPRLWRDADLDRGGGGPEFPGNVRCVDQRMCDEAPVNLDHLAGPVPAQAGFACLVDSEGNHGPPAEAVLVPINGLHDDVAGDPGDAAQLLAHDLSLQLSLKAQARVLPVTASAASGPGVGARWLDAVRRRPQNLDRLRPGEPASHLGHDGADPLAWQGMSDESNPARIILSGNAPPAMHDFPDGKFQHVPCPGNGGALLDGHGLHRALVVHLHPGWVPVWLAAARQRDYVDCTAPVGRKHVHIVIMGCGRVGSTIAHILEDQGHSVAIIDQDPESFRKLHSGFKGTKVTGVGFDRDVLMQAGIERAGAFAAVSSGDNSNVIAARVARESFGVERVVARIYDPRRAEVYQRLGIPTVATVAWTADQMMRRLLPEGAESLWRDPTGAVVLAEVAYSEDWLGQKVWDLESAAHVRVAFISRLGEALIPSPSLVLQEGDVVHVIAEERNLSQITSVFAAGQPGRGGH